MELAMRKDVPVELTWDLSLIYPTDAAMEADLEEAKKLADHIEAAYPGRLNDPEMIVECLREYEQLQIKLYLISSYTDLAG